jgi:hypothetical protein
VLSFKNGALIAIAAGSLFAAACEKSKEKKPEPAAETKPGEAKPGVAPADMKDPKDMKTAPAKPGEKTSKIHCMGVNACKGQGECKTANNGCAGQNGCDGKGFIDMAEEDCKAKGGSVMTATKM